MRSTLNHHTLPKKCCCPMAGPHLGSCSGILLTLVRPSSVSNPLRRRFTACIDSLFPACVSSNGMLASTGIAHFLWHDTANPDVLGAVIPRREGERFAVVVVGCNGDTIGGLGDTVLLQPTAALVEWYPQRVFEIDHQGQARLSSVFGCRRSYDILL